MGTPAAAPLAAETARVAVVPTSVPSTLTSSLTASTESRARTAFIDGLLARGRPATPVDPAARSYAQAQLQGVPLNVLQVLEKSNVRIVVLHRGESLIDVGAVRPIDVKSDYGDGASLRAQVDGVRKAVDATYLDQIKTLQQKLTSLSNADPQTRENVQSDLDIARSDRNEALYKGVYEATGGRVDQQDGMSAGADALGLDAAGPLSPVDVARIHGARTPQDIEGYVRLLRTLNGDERLEAAQRHYAAEPGAASTQPGDVATRPMRLWREGIVVPSYEYWSAGGAPGLVVHSTDAESMRQWSAGNVEGQYFYEGSGNTLVVHERNLGHHAEPNRVLLHELGHAYEDAVSEQAPNSFSQWQTRRDADFARMRDNQGRFPSDYATRSASELSAETFADRFDGHHPAGDADAAWGRTYDALLGAAPQLAPNATR